MFSKIYNRNTGKQIRFDRTLKAFGAPPTLQKDKKGKFNLFIQELKLNHKWFWTYSRMSVGQFQALPQMVPPHLSRQSSNHLSG